MSANVKKPFEGIRVVDLTTYLAAPLGGRLMAEMGADVIKIEAFKGDPYRTYGPAMHVPATETENPVFDAYNGSKKSCPINLKDEKGLEILFKLLDEADVFLTNNRVQALKKMGIDYDSLRERYPKLVYVTVSGYGMKGPDVNEPGFDSIAFFGRSGLMTDVVMKGNAPNYPLSAGGDNLTGLFAYTAIVTALLARERTGKGDHIDVSLYGAGTWMTGLIMLCDEFGEVYPKDRYELKPVNNNVYECADGVWVTFTILEFERYFRTFCEALENPSLADDPRWQTRADALKHRDTLIREIEGMMKKFPAAEVEKRLRAADIVVCRLRNSKELPHDPQALENDYIRKVTCESGTTCNMFINPLKSENIGNYEFRRGPLMGEHTVEILSHLGYSQEEIGKMKDDGVILVHD